MKTKSKAEIEEIIKKGQVKKGKIVTK